jgi:hypothetical protein
MSDQTQKNPNLQSRSPAQLAILAQARERAKVVRSDNAKLKAQEREVLKLEKDKAKEDKKKDITERMNKLKANPIVLQEEEIEETEAEPPTPAPAPAPAPAPTIKKSIKKKKKVVVYVSDSESEEEQEIVYVTKPKVKKAPRIVHVEPEKAKPEQPQRKYLRPEHEALYQKMFKI